MCQLAAAFVTRYPKTAEVLNSFIDQEAAGFACGAQAFHNCTVPPSGTGGALLGQLSLALGTARMPSGGGAAKAGRTLSNDEILKGVSTNADEVKIGRTAKDAGDFVNIKFKDGTVANIRVETHPPSGLHGNVQIWKKGEEVVN